MNAVPVMIQRILRATAMLAIVWGLYWSQKDMAGAVTMVCAVAWGMANLVAWAYFAHIMLKGGEDKGLMLAALGFVKITLLGGGLVAVKFAAPLSGGQVVGLVLGLSLCIFVAFLMALGARLTGRQMANGPVEPERQRVSIEPDLGGQL